MFLLNKTQRLMVCFGNAVYLFLTLNYPRHSSLQNQVSPVYLNYPFVLLLLFPPQIKTLLHPTCFHCNLPDSSKLQGKIKSIYFSTTSSISFMLHPASSLLLPRRVLQQLATTKEAQGHLVCCITELLVQRLQSSACYGQRHGS